MTVAAAPVAAGTLAVEAIGLRKVFGSIIAVDGVDFTLEHDFVLAKQSNRTLLCEREGQKHGRCGDGPALTGNAGDDARAFVDCFMELIVPTKVTRK